MIRRSRDRSTGRLMVALLGLVVLAAACTPGSSTTTTAPPNTTSTTGAPGTTDGGSGSTTTSDPRAELIEQAKAISWQVGQGSSTGTYTEGVGDRGMTAMRIALTRAMENMREQGWDVQSAWLADLSAVMEAAATGDIDIVTGPMTAILGASSAGEPLKMFGVMSAPDWNILGKVGLSPEDMDGKRISYQAPLGITHFIYQLWLAGYDVEPEPVLIAQPADRMIALLAGEIDTTAAKLGDDIKAEESAPGEFEVLYWPVEAYPELLDLSLAYNDANCDELCKVFAEELALEQLRVSREIIEDPSLIETWGAEYETVDRDPRVADYLFGDVALSAESLQKMIDLMEEHGQVPEGTQFPDPQDLIDESILTAVAARLDG